MDEKWLEPIEAGEGCCPWVYTGWFDIDEVDAFRHVHCLYYEECLDAACRRCKSSLLTWACPQNCVGRLTFVVFPQPVLSKEMLQYLIN